MHRRIQKSIFVDPSLEHPSGSPLTRKSGSTLSRMPGICLDEDRYDGGCLIPANAINPCRSAWLKIQISLVQITFDAFLRFLGWAGMVGEPESRHVESAVPGGCPPSMPRRGKGRTGIPACPQWRLERDRFECARPRALSAPPPAAVKTSSGVRHPRSSSLSSYLTPARLRRGALVAASGAEAPRSSRISSRSAAARSNSSAPAASTISRSSASIVAATS